MTVKADSKGRLTGAQPETRYVREEHPDGAITYVPEVPRAFEEHREVSYEEFEAFFGVSPEYVAAEDGITTAPLHNKNSSEYLPHGLVVTRYKVYENGLREYPEGNFAETPSATRLKTLIRIKKAPK